jgi:hypothetical protein
MHTILMSRGDKNYRLATKTMLDGEMFLEDKMEYHPEGLEKTARKSRVHIWAQMGDPIDPKNPGPIDVTDWIVRFIQAHIDIYKTNGYTLTDTDDIPVEDVLVLSQEPGRNDRKARPHGATQTPMPYRIAAYDAQGRLSSFTPVGPEHVAQKVDVDTAQENAAAALGAEVTKLRN